MPDINYLGETLTITFAKGDRVSVGSVLEKVYETTRFKTVPRFLVLLGPSDEELTADERVAFGRYIEELIGAFRVRFPSMAVDKPRATPVFQMSMAAPPQPSTEASLLYSDIIAVVTKTYKENEVEKLKLLHRIISAALSV